MNKSLGRRQVLLRVPASEVKLAKRYAEQNGKGLCERNAQMGYRQALHDAVAMLVRGTKTVR